MERLQGLSRLLVDGAEVGDDAFLAIGKAIRLRLPLAIVGKVGG